MTSGSGAGLATCMASPRPGRVVSSGNERLDLAQVSPKPQAVMAVTSAIDALCDAIGHTTPAEVVAGLNPAALIRLARDAELASAWLGALQVLAASAARRCGADQGAPPIAPSEAVGTQATPAAFVAPEASRRGGCS